MAVIEQGARQRPTDEPGTAYDRDLHGIAATLVPNKRATIA